MRVAGVQPHAGHMVTDLTVAQFHMLCDNLRGIYADRFAGSAVQVTRGDVVAAARAMVRVDDAGVNQTEADADALVSRCADVLTPGARAVFDATRSIAFGAPPLLDDILPTYRLPNNRKTHNRRQLVAWIDKCRSYVRSVTIIPGRVVTYELVSSGSPPVYVTVGGDISAVPVEVKLMIIEFYDVSARMGKHGAALRLVPHMWF